MDEKPLCDRVFGTGRDGLVGRIHQILEVGSRKNELSWFCNFCQCCHTVEIVEIVEYLSEYWLKGCTVVSPLSLQLINGRVSAQRSAIIYASYAMIGR